MVFILSFRHSFIPSFHLSILPLLLPFIFLLSSYSGFSQFTITPSTSSATCPDSSNGTASVSVSGGSLPYTYQWLPDGQTSSSITALTPGTYSVTITDNGGNDSTVSFVIGPTPFVSNENIQVPVCTSNGYIVLSESGGTAPYQYAWSTGNTDQGITGIGAGYYSVIVTDANSCTAIYSYTIELAPCFVNPAPFFTPNSDNFNDVWFIDNAQYFDNAHLIVFDRWGTRVHEQKGTYEPWDGKNYFGMPVPSSVYYYFFYQEKEDKQKNAISGSVTIMR